MNQLMLISSIFLHSTHNVVSMSLAWSIPLADVSCCRWEKEAAKCRVALHLPVNCLFWIFLTYLTAAWYLPGYGRDIGHVQNEPKRPASPVSEIGSETLSTDTMLAAVPLSKQPITEQSQSAHQVTDENTPRAHDALVPRHLGTLQATRETSPQVPVQTHGAQNQPSSLRTTSQKFKDSPAKARWRSGADPDGRS